MKLTKVPNWIRRLKSDRIWDFSASESNIYLTFDDGPQEEITEWVLDLLKKENIHASFFCVGNNVEKHPEIYSRILQEGHSVGNHTYSHRNAWKTKKKDYLKDIVRANGSIQTNLFRPPYGKISGTLTKEINDLGLEVVMWSLLSYDFENDLDVEKQIEKIKDRMEPGDVIVFHDSVKASENLKKMLPSIIKHVKDQDWSFQRIELP